MQISDKVEKNDDNAEKEKIDEKAKKRGVGGVGS